MGQFIDKEFPVLVQFLVAVAIVVGAYYAFERAYREYEIGKKVGYSILGIIVLYVAFTGFKMSVTGFQDLL